MAKKNLLTRSRIRKAEELMHAGQLAEAHKLCTQSCQTNRSDAQAWSLLCMLERRLGHLAEAEQAGRHATRLAPNLAFAHQALGMALQCRGELTAAIASYQKAIALSPSDAQLHYLLGNALRETHAMSEADASYARAIELRPDFIQALSNRGPILISQRRYQEAKQCLDRANQLQPGVPQVICNIALLSNALGYFDEAKAYCRDALMRDSDFIDALALLADLQEKTHQIAEARKSIEHGLHIDPDNVSLHLTLGRIERREGDTDDAITRLEGLRARRPDLPQHDLLLLLGQLYDKNKDAEKAFYCLNEGNRLKARFAVADAEEAQAYLRHIEELRRQFHADHPETWRTFPEDDFSDNPIFLFGFPRSGTTLLEQILDSHPQLQALPEKPAIAAARKGLGERRLSDLTLDDVRKLRKIYFDEVALHLRREPGRILVDKMPLNTVDAQLIWRLFPNAKCILAIRHPCDACFSCFMQNFTLNAAMNSFFSLENTAAAYAHVMSLWQEYIKALPIDYYRIRYEDLVADQAGESRRLLEFLGLNWSDCVLRHDEHARKRNIATPSYHQVSQPIYQDAKYRWKRYEKYMQPVLPILQPYIEYFGYGEDAGATNTHK